MRLVALALALLGQSVVIQLGVPDGPEFLLRLSPPVTLDRCHVDSYQSGPFGGYGSLPVRATADGGFALRTGLGGKPAHRLKIALWCAGYGMQLVDVPSLEVSGWARSLTLAPLVTRRLEARVAPSDDGMTLAGSQVRAYYVAYWLCGFYNLPDCMVPTWQVASGHIAAAGVLELQVPDFAADPVAYGDAAFRLMADVEGVPANYWLELPNATFGHVPVSITHKNLVLHPRRR